MGVGSTFRAMSPRGKFTLDESSNRPIVLLSAGVGITPMISMLEQLAADCASCREPRPVWFIHGARNSIEHAFAGKVSAYEQQMPCLTANFVYSQPVECDRQGSDYEMRVRTMCDECKKIGRDPKEVEVTVGIGSGAMLERPSNVNFDTILSYESLGVSRVVLASPRSDKEGVKKELHEFGDRVLSKL